MATTQGIRCSNLFRYDTISSCSINTSESIEDHPGFRMMVHHEVTGNDNFHRWIADGFPGSGRGYNKLKNRLLAKNSSGSTLGRPTVDGGGSNGSSAGEGRGLENDEGQSSGSGQFDGNFDRSKRQRQCPQQQPEGSSSSGGMDASAVDFMRHLMDNVDRKHDIMYDLREKIARLELEKRNMEFDISKMVSEHINQLATKDTKINSFLGEIDAMKTAAEQQRLIMEEAVAKLHEMEKLQVGILLILC